LGWRWLFAIDVPVALAAMVVTVLVVQESRDPSAHGVDVTGVVLATAGFGLLSFGLLQGPDVGWGSAQVVLSLTGAVAALVAFVVVELRTEAPLVNIRIFAAREFVVDNAVLFLASIAFVPAFFFASVYSQVSLGYDANQAGLYLLVLFGGFAPMAQVGGRMLDRAGARRPIILGSALAAVGFALWGSKLHDYSLGAQWPFIVMAGAGIGLLLGPASTDAVNRAIDASYGEVTGITQTVRNYASSLGLAVLGTVLTTVLTSRLTSSLVGLGVPHHQAAEIAHDGARGNSHGPADAPAAIAQQLHAAVANDFASATQGVLYGMAIALGLCFLAALRYPRTTE
jgi:predicted MFS family arabinose efflux permease